MDELNRVEKILISEESCGAEKFNVIKWILDNNNQNDLIIINAIQGIPSIKCKNIIKSFVDNIKNKCS